MKEDPRDIKAFARLLQRCRTVMMDLGTVGPFGEQPFETYGEVTFKLSTDLAPQVRCKIEKEERREASFNDFVALVKDTSEEWNHPIFGLKKDEKQASPNLQDQKNKSFALATTGSGGPFPEVNGSERCLFCDKHHDMSNCEAAMILPVEERRLKLNGRCFGCRGLGHWSRTCRRRRRCKTCGKAHPSILHYDQTSVRADLQGAPLKIGHQELLIKGN